MKLTKDQTERTFDIASESYSKLVEEAVAVPGFAADFFTRVKADYIRDLSLQHFGPIAGLSVLDVGCGIGNFHGPLSPLFGRLEGADISKGSLEIAAKKYPDVGYSHYDGHRLPYEDASFDLVFAVCVMHHVPSADWPQFVREMRRVIRPGGLALVFEHNPANPLTMRTVNRCPFDEGAELLRPRQMMDLFETAGFVDARVRSILSVPPVGAFLRGVDRVLGRLPIGAQYYISAGR
jgi:ubiquinone/menaquinone biosynthesis C-methylase UbiE